MTHDANDTRSSTLESADRSPILEVKNLVTQFGPGPRGFRAVNDVSLTLYPGKTLCVVGESGSGKSAMARSILQIVDAPGRVVSGQILFHRHRSARGEGDQDTVDIAALGPRSAAIRAVRGREIAMIFQEPMSSLSPVHRIGDQIGEVLRLHEGLSKKQARGRVIDLLAQVEIPKPELAIDRYPFEYSGGMRQRAMIAMALACDPSILIADEPTTALDVTIQAEILALIGSLQKQRGMSVLFITHDMGVVAEIADEIAVMRRGELVEFGNAFDVFEKPQHDYTKSLLAAVKGLDRPSPRRLEMRASKPIGETLLAASAVRKDFTMTSGWLGRTKLVTQAVRDIDLYLRSGENLGIVGESGSGKTTLGRCLQRVYDVSGGRIGYTDRQGQTTDLAALSEQELRVPWRDIRTVFQDPFGSLNPRMTVAQIIGEPLIVAGTHKGEALRRRVIELLDMVGLPASAMQRYPHAFSGGQRQRISIARAIAPNPRIIIADEATSALDVALRSQILDLLLDLQARLEISFILISHDIAVVRYFCDRIAVMHQGRIVETGDTDAVCRDPTHPYTQSLLSSVLVADPRFRGSRKRERFVEA